ncbi:MAG: hypothetical protein ACE10C_02430, partial [Candidatus Binatia bacterium]
LESDIVLDSRKKSGLILSTRGPDLASVTGDPLPLAAFPFHQLYQGRVLPHAGVALMAGPLWRSRRRDRGRLHIAGLLPRPPHDHTDLRRARIGRTQGKCSVVWP